MRRLLYLVFVSNFLLLGLQTAEARITVGSSYEADQKCSGNFRCDPETIAPDNRAPLPVYQPSNINPVQGACGQIPQGKDYMARSPYLQCAVVDGQKSHLRERIPYTQEELDDNLSYLQVGKTLDARKAAQQILLKKDYGWTEQFKFNAVQRWTYKVKTGGYTDCRGQFGAEGGQPEQYQTTCYRENRQEHFVRTVYKKRKYCAAEKSAPPPPPPTRHDDDDDNNTSTPIYNPSQRPSGTGSSNSGGSGNYSGGPTRSTPKQNRSASPDGSAPKGKGESFQENRKRVDRGWKKNHSQYTPLGHSRLQPVAFNFVMEEEPSIVRFPAEDIRRLPSRDEVTEDPEPEYGCDRWETKNTGSSDEYVWQAADDDISYSCAKTHSTWCTWYVDQEGSSQCPEQKTLQVNVKYLTPKDWSPENPKYDDQLPNGFDLLLGEAEVVKTSVNQSGQYSSQFSASVDISNYLNRSTPWNKYQTNFQPQSVSCQYQDLKIDANVNTLGRIVQTAPNTLVIPEQAVQRKDERGRPRDLIVMNPFRNFVLDRSNLSRSYGEGPNKDAKANSQDLKDDPALKHAGITNKFWETTRFWMRLVWFDKKTKVRVTLGRPFEINQAGAVGDQLTISLAKERGMERFYKLSVPFEKFFGFLGGDVSMDPKKQYYIELKVAQPGFDGIYLSGLNNDPTISLEEKKLINNDAYSESIYIPVPKVESTRSLLDEFWDWRSRHIWRP